MNNNKYAMGEAVDIIAEYSRGVMKSTKHYINSDEELYASMMRECSFILAARFECGYYTPQQYYSISISLGHIIRGSFYYLFDDK